MASKRTTKTKVDVDVDVVQPNISNIKADDWYNEIASHMNGKFSDKFIIEKAKLAFGYTFDESRYIDTDTDMPLFDKVQSVWESQK